MANEKDITVHIEGKPAMHFPLGTSQEIIQAAVKKQVGGGGPSTGERLWEAANMPLGEKEGLPKGGIPEKARNLLINVLSKQNLSDENRRRLFYALDIPSELLTSIPEAGRRMTTPLGIATMGSGNFLERLRRAAGVPRAVKAAVAGTEAGAGGAFGAQGLQQALSPQKPGESSLDYWERVLSGAGQALFGTSAVGHVAGPAVESGTRTGIRSISDRSQTAVEAAARTAGEKSAAEQREYQEARRQHEKEEGERQTQFKKEQAETQKEFENQFTAASSKAKGEFEQKERDVDKARAKGQKEYQEELQQQQRRQQLQTAREDTAKSLAANLDTAERNEKQQLDDRYADLDRKILGVTPENPNGTLKARIDPVASAIDNARKNILKGSQTNIQIFNDIIRRVEMLETPEGNLKAVEGQFIPTSQLRGYVRELGDAIYDRENVPGDVRQAIKAVEQAAKAEVAKSIEDVHGKGAKAIYDQLSADWESYKRTWFDRSPNHPLARIRRIFRDPSVEKSDLSVDEQIAGLIKGEKGRNVVRMLSEKTRYGADGSIANRLMAIDNQLAKLPKREAEVKPPEPVQEPNVAKVRFPKTPEAKEPPKPRPAPEPPENTPFNRAQFIKEGVEKRMRQAGNWGSLLGIASSISDLIRGEPGAALKMGEKVALIQGLKELLTSPRILDWVSREGQSGAFRGFFGGGETPAPRNVPRETPPPGFKGGISAKGTEEATRKGTTGDLVRSLYAEQDDLRERARTTPPGPQQDIILQRMIQNAQIIRDFEQGGRPR